MFFIAPIAQAQDKALINIYATLVPLRPALGPDGKQLADDDKDYDSDLRHATPALTAVKHILRDWIEAHLSALVDLGDDKVIAAAINDELRKADLLCDTPTDKSWNRCTSDISAWSHLGFLAAVRVEFLEHGRVILVHTGVGILCGMDESAYVYAWQKDKWQRFWQNEQEIASGKPYAPQYIDAIEVTRPDEKTNDRFVLSLGHMGWCASNFYPVYFRLWRSNPGLAESKLLLDRAEDAYLGAHIPPIIGSVTDKGDVLIEFTTTSIDIAIHSYETVRHYRVVKDEAVRLDPIALSPRSFTEEWLKADWQESASWTAASNAKALQAWHKKRHLDASGPFIDDTKNCRKDRAFWQVSLGIGGDREHQEDTYFIVRWRPPYRFEMVDVRTTPRTDCNQPDPSVDSGQTLFPIQDWRN